MSLLQMSFCGAILILTVVVIRAAAINRLPKKTFLVLWGIVLLRLIIPFSIPSALSVYSFMNQNTSISTLNDTPMNNIIPVIQEKPVELTEEISELTVHPVQHVSMWFVIWLIGTILCTAFFTVSYLRCYFEFQTSLPVHNDFVNQWLKENPLMRPLSIRQLDKISTPLTYGILKPVILLPKKTDWENKIQLQFILLHEYVHICRYDTLTKLVSIFALCIHWFNPLVWIMYILINRDIELSCDESVIRKFGETSKSTYAHMLINMEAKKSGLLPFCNNFSKNPIEERITAIIKIKKKSFWTILPAIVLIIGITIIFTTSATKLPSPEQEPILSDHSDDRQKNTDTDNISTVSSQEEQLVDDGIHNNKHNIYEGKIGNEKIRMLITRREDVLAATYITTNNEEKVFHGTLKNNSASIILHANDKEYLKGRIESTDGLIHISGEGLISGKSVEFIIYPDTIFFIGDDIENYYSFLGETAKEAEQFAQQIKDSIKNKNAFAKLILYPISVNMDNSRVTIENEEEMRNIYDKLMEQHTFQQQVENIFTKYMFANSEGICVEQGLIWFNKISTGYKITAINN